MKFSAFDIISKLVPGSLLLAICLAILLSLYMDSQFGKHYIEVLKSFDGLLTVLVTLLAYLVGYVLEAIGSLLIEPIVWRIWGGWPIELLYKNKPTKRTTFPQYKKVFNVLTKEYFGEDKEILSRDELDELYYFSSETTRRHGSEEQNSRQQSYIESYVFSRNVIAGLFISIIVSIIGVFTVGYYWIYSLILLIVIFVIVYIRLKDRSLYQVRNLLNSAY
ncbi:MAG: hypothetical protein HC906_11990, partial [Bacteroidales bacterium]|nr:hypothetical protein [Bacteroidales bacterium]